MSRPLRTTLIAVAIVTAACAALLLYLLQDANRFKPQLQALIADQTGVPVRIDGDLQWRLWPPLSLRAEEVRAVSPERTWDAAKVTLHLDLFQLIGSPEAWEVRSVTVHDLIMRQQGDLLEVAEARLADLAPNRPARLSAALRYTAEDQAPVPLRLAGHLRVDPATSELALLDTRLESDRAAGICNAEAAPTAGEADAPAPGDEHELIPLALFRTIDWRGDCLFDWVEQDGQRFEQVAARFRNSAGNSIVELDAPQFFGGRAQAEIGIDAAGDPVRWQIAPTLNDVDSSELLAWLDQGLQWVAPLAYGGTLTLEGNTPDALLASLSGETRFDGGQGRINIAGIRSQLLTLAAMFNEGERVERWPEVWEYQRLVGEWRIDRQRHHLDLALDNLAVTGSGDYHPATEEIDLVLELTFRNDPQWPVFQLHPMLYDLPIPIRCRGPLEDPTCRLDSGAAQRIVAQALAGGEDNALRASLEEKIDTQVPAQYRDAARSLLDLLGGSRQDRGERGARDR